MALVLALLLDALMGEPRWIWDRVPHPAVLMGKAISWCDGRLNFGANRKAKGILVLAVLLALAWGLGAALTSLPTILPEVLIAAVLLAQKSLTQHVQAVADALRISTHDGRNAVAMIVGRDTSQMDQSAISRAAIESAAENLSDGVIAPAFWFLVLGLPGLLVYKITNTADSMIGYKTNRHRDFGWASARFDDLLNLIPARLTALLIWVAAPKGRWSNIIAEARLHRSPNAGWPEAAIAPALGIALSGPRSYDGKVQDFPWVNEAGRKAVSPDDIDRSVALLWKAWAVFLGLAVLATLI